MNHPSSQDYQPRHVLYMQDDNGSVARADRVVTAEKYQMFLRGLMDVEDLNADPENIWIDGEIHFENMLEERR